MTVAFQNRPVSPLAKKTAWLVVGESTARTVRIVIAIVLVKLLPVLEWNAVALALTIYLAALTIGSLNLEQSILYFLPKLSDFDERRLFAQTVAFLMGIAVLIAAVCSVLLSHLEVLRSYVRSYRSRFLSLRDKSSKLACGILCSAFFSFLGSQFQLEWVGEFTESSLD
jgi:O-antigen/teichoic acid export membrane protein